MDTISYWCFCDGDALRAAVRDWANDYRHEDTSRAAAVERAAAVRAFLDSRQARDYGLIKGGLNGG